MSSKQSPHIPHVSTIEQILELFPYLQYSTQKRNLAHHMQLKEFLQSIYLSYRIDRGLEVMYNANIVKVIADIVETLLYCSILQAKYSIPKGKGKAMKLIQVAKVKRIISKETANILEKIISFRNNYHPDKQLGLVVKTETVFFDRADTVLMTTIEEIAHYFTSQEKLLCPNHEVYMSELPWGEPCPFCHLLF